VSGGTVTVTATVQGVTATAQVVISPLVVFAPGTVLWTAPATPGFAAMQVVHAAPSTQGPDLYSVHRRSDGTQSLIQAFTADGQQMWEATVYGGLAADVVPDGFGGLLIIAACDPDDPYYSPMVIMALDGGTGMTLWQRTVSTGGMCLPGVPRFAVRQDGAVAIAMPLQVSPAMIVVDGLTGAEIYRPLIPPSTFESQLGSYSSDGFTPVGQPVVDIDSSIRTMYAVRVTTPNQQITSVLSLLTVTEDGTATVTELGTSTVGNLWPGQLMPDGEGGILATWVSAPNSQATTHPYRAAFVSSAGGVSAFDMPMAPETAPKDPKTLLPLLLPLALGQNGNAFVSYGSNITSFVASSGAVNWNLPSSASLVAALEDGAVAINDAVQGIFSVDAGGAVTQVTSGATASEVGYSSTQEWAGVTGAELSGLTLPISVDPANSWPTTSGSASGQFAAMSLCPCLTQTDNQFASNFDRRGAGALWARAAETARSEGTSWWKAIVKTAQAALPFRAMAAGRPFAAALKLAGVPRSFDVRLPSGGTALYAPAAFRVVGKRHLVLVGDGGFPGGGHSVGALFDIASATFAATLTAAGDTFISKRVSTVTDVNDALTLNQTFDGTVTYFGHAAQQKRANLKVISLLAVGAASGDHTNVSELNVSQLSNAKLGPNVTIVLRACNAALRTPTNNASIAQLMANQLNRPVQAWMRGLWFTNDLSRRFPRDKEIAPGTSPIYLIPLGGIGVQPCTFMPNQPEPQNCGIR
jgi:hypothetical protein